MSDAIPGDPEAIMAGAAELARCGQRFHDLRDSIVSNARRTAAEWTGTASEMALDRLLWLGTRVRIAGQCCADAAPVLRDFAEQLRIGQRLYDRALQRERDARTAYKTAAPGPAGEAVRTEAAGEIIEAKALMGDALARVQSSDELATTRIDGLLAEVDKIWPHQPPAPPPQPPADEDDGWSFSDIGHAVLDVVGLVPVVGEPADAANAGWYAAEGDYVNAALSAAAMVPIAGWAATGGKLGIKGVKMVRTADGARAFVKGKPSMVPRHAKRKEFAPNDKFPHGEKYVYTDPQTGKKVQYHAHGRDPDRSATENAGQGPIYRKRVGNNHYADGQGNLHSRNSLDKNSKAYNPQAVNDTHIPYPKDQPRPDQPHVRITAPNPAGLAGSESDQE